MTSKQLKASRRRMIEEHAERIRALDVEIAKASLRERSQLPGGNETEVMKLIFRIKSNNPHATNSDVAAALNFRGITGPNGKRWSGVGVERWINARQIVIATGGL